MSTLDALFFFALQSHRFGKRLHILSLDAPSLAAILQHVLELGVNQIALVAWLELLLIS